MLLSMLLNSTSVLGNYMTVYAFVMIYFLKLIMKLTNYPTRPTTPVPAPTISKSPEQELKTLLSEYKVGSLPHSRFTNEHGQPSHPIRERSLIHEGAVANLILPEKIKRDESQWEESGISWAQPKAQTEPTEGGAQRPSPSSSSHMPLPRLYLPLPCCRPVTEPSVQCIFFG